MFFSASVYNKILLHLGLYLESSVATVQLLCLSAEFLHWLVMSKVSTPTATADYLRTLNLSAYHKAICLSENLPLRQIMCSGLPVSLRKAWVITLDPGLTGPLLWHFSSSVCVLPDGLRDLVIYSRKASHGLADEDLWLMLRKCFAMNTEKGGLPVSDLTDQEQTVVRSQPVYWNLKWLKSC